LLAVRARGMRAIPKGGCYSEVMTSRHQELDDNLRGEEAIVALLAPLTEGDPGAFGLQDDCALLAPESGTELVLKTDPIAEGVHFLPGTAPEDIAWKALAVNVSDLAAKGATPVGYLMALSFPNAPSRRWFTAFAAGLKEAQSRFGCRLLGGDTDRRWVRCRRPMVMVGGELSLDQLELSYSPALGFYRAPIQAIANGGVLVIDDFGRQRCAPRDLLNRWIVPLESRVDFLALQTGQKFDIPFMTMIVFATNIRPGRR